MRRAAVVALAACTATAAAAAACSSFDYLTQSPALPPRAADCGGCHVEIYEEFRASPHAQAWTRPAFRVATADRAFGECLGCHAPDTVYGGGPPRVRDAHRDEGVTCLTCHFDDGAMVGPVDSTALVDPHPVAVRRDIYRRSDLCGVCHEGTFREWQEHHGDDERTCQDCHMEPVERTVTQGTDVLSRALVSFESKAAGRRHTFHVPAVADLGGAFRSELLRLPDDGETIPCRLTLTSLVPHLVPTGDFGFRRLTVRAQALSADGTALATEEWPLFKELAEALRPREPRSFLLRAPRSAAAVRVRITTSKRDGEPQTVHERELALP